MARPKLPRLTKAQAVKITLGTKLSPSAAQRVAEATRLMSQLLPMNQVYVKLLEKFQVGKLRAQQIVKQARQLWADEQETDPAEQRRQYVNAYKLFYNQAMAKEAHGPARAALRDLTILEGCNPEVTAQNRANDALANATSALDPDRVRERMNELIEKRAQAKAGAK